MEKNNWLSFLSTNLQSQIQLEWTRKLQTWGLFLIGFAAFGFASSAIGDSESRVFLFTSKVLFLVFFHLIAIFGFYLPLIMQKGEGAVAGFLGVRDFKTLSITYVLAVLTLVTCTMLGWQILSDLKSLSMSGLFAFAAWLNFLIISLYLIGAFVFGPLYFFAPNLLVKFSEKSSKVFYAFLGAHVVAAIFLFVGYADVVKVGTLAFFEQARIISLFWAFIVTLTLAILKLLQGSVVPAISALQLEVASGKLTRSEDILKRYQEVFVLKRLAFWVKRISHRAATYAHEIAQYTHDAVTLAEKEVPRELELRQVEDFYKKADGLSRKLEKENARFLLSIAVFNMTEPERDRIEKVRDIFSKELRNAKLELVSVRKRIDNKLVTIKNIERPKLSSASIEKTQTPSEPEATEVPAEEELPLKS